MQNEITETEYAKAEQEFFNDYKDNHFKLQSLKKTWKFSTSNKSIEPLERDLIQFIAVRNKIMMR